LNKILSHNAADVLSATSTPSKPDETFSVDVTFGHARYGADISWRSILIEKCVDLVYIISIYESMNVFLGRVNRLWMRKLPTLAPSRAKSYLAEIFSETTHSWWQITWR
jgi:hypothetical protein